MRRKLRVVVPSINERSARSAAVSVLLPLVAVEEVDGRVTDEEDEG